MNNNSIKLIIVFFLFTNYLFAKTTYIYNNNQGKKDKRKFYEIEILKLSLEKTKEKYGEYELVPGPKMNLSRALQTIRDNTIENFILKSSASKKFTEEFAYSNFPIDRGVTGYRVSFISPKIKEKINKYNSLEKIKKLKIGQGVGWLDTNILLHNGFKVKTISSYDGIFYMVALNRVDLFPRGISEFLSEYNEFKNIENLDYDKTFLIYYPLPRFFFTNKLNEKAIKRIEEGLKIAYEDGSLDMVFNKYYKKSIDFLEIENRKLYEIENPLIKGLDKSYEKYIFNPYKGQN